MYIIEIFGVLYLALGISIFFHKSLWNQWIESLIKKPFYLLSWGGFALVVGTYLVMQFTDPYFLKEKIMFVIGCISLFKSFFMLFFPKKMSYFVNKIMEVKYVLYIDAIISVILGIILLFY